MDCSRMRISHCILCLSALLIGLESEAVAQTGWRSTPVVPAIPTQMYAPVGLPAVEIERLVAPIALYPDVLVSQILPASTFPIEIVKAARWLRGNPNLNTLSAQQWESPVASLSHYPQVLFMLDEDLDWTNALGAAFLDQTVDVMDAIQRLRARANASGALLTTNQHTVVVERETIRIVPTQREVVYIPRYDTRSMFFGGGGTRVSIGFSTGLALGSWLDLDFNWRQRNVHFVRPGYWSGWAHRGTVGYGNNWGSGLHGGIGFGSDRGFFAGPRRGVAGNGGHGSIWRRPAINGRPVYSGRYSSYSRRSSGFNRIRQQRRASTTRLPNFRNARNFDRGRRQRDARRQPNSAGHSRQDNRRSRSAFGNRSQGRNANQFGRRGNRSRSVQQGRRNSGAARRDHSDRKRSNRGNSARSRSGKSRSSFGDRRGRSSVDRSGKRGKASRGKSSRQKNGRRRSGRSRGGR